MVSRNSEITAGSVEPAISERSVPTWANPDFAENWIIKNGKKRTKRDKRRFILHTVRKEETIKKTTLIVKRRAVRTRMIGVGGQIAHVLLMYQFPSLSAKFKSARTELMNARIMTPLSTQNDRHPATPEGPGFFPGFQLPHPYHQSASVPGYAQ